MSTAVNKEHLYTYHHAPDTDCGTSYEAAGISYTPLEQVWPSELGDEGGEYVTECNDALGRGWWYEVECGRQNDNIEDCGQFRHLHGT